MPDLDLGKKLNITKDANFHFGIPELPLFSLFCQTLDLPSVTLGVAEQPTPLVEVKHPGDKIVFEDLMVSFLVDEELTNYLEVFKWIMHLGYPRSTSQYRKLVQQDTVYTRKHELQCSLLTNKMNFRQRIVFVGAFPTNLSTLPFTTNNEGVGHLTATATFAYDYYYFEDGSGDSTL